MLEIRLLLLLLLNVVRLLYYLKFNYYVAVTLLKNVICPEFCKEKCIHLTRLLVRKLPQRNQVMQSN